MSGAGILPPDDTVIPPLAPPMPVVNDLLASAGAKPIAPSTSAPTPSPAPVEPVQAAAPTASAVSSPTPKKPPPPIGTVMGGYRFQGGNPATPEAWKPLEGDEYLKTLSPQDASTVKMMVDGRLPPPTSFAMSKPYWQQKIQQAARVDPSFDAANWSTRLATRKDFSAGKSAQAITSFNTAMQHIAKLSQAANALQNHSFTPFNAVGNAIEPMAGDPRVNNFNVAKNAVVDELTRAFRGSGGNVHDIENWENSLSPNMSPQQFHGAVAQALELLKGRMESLGDQYKRGMGKSIDPKMLLSPGAQKAFDTLTQKYEAPKAGPSQTSIPKISSDDDYAALPSGADFIAPDGSHRRKP
jgi:hypothetical protein